MSKQIGLTTEPAMILIADKGPNGSNAIRVAELIQARTADNGDKELQVRVWDGKARDWVGAGPNKPKGATKWVSEACNVGGPPPGDGRVVEIERWRKLYEERLAAKKEHGKAAE